MQPFLNRFKRCHTSTTHPGSPSPGGAPIQATSDLRSQRFGFRRTVVTESATRRRIANLVASQSNQQPLQAIEHLARGNRQMAVLAAVVSAETEIDYTKEYRLARFLPNDNLHHRHFVRTADEGVQKIRHQDVVSEGAYRIRLSSIQHGRVARVTTPAFTPDRSKSEILVHVLLTALAENSDEQATIAVQRAGSDRHVHLLKEDLLHERVVAHLPWQPAAAQTPPAQCGAVQTSPTDRLGAVAALDPGALAAEVMSLNHLAHLEFIQRLAVRSEPCATFFSFMSHALLIKDSTTAAPLERYPYVADAALLSEKIKSSGNPFLPTFLDGVERYYDRFNTDNASWRIHTEGAWQPGQDKRAVLIHVFLQAIQHLHAPAPTTPDMPMYPLVAYELLADAIGMPVPQYLVEHEQGILSRLTENRLHDEQRKQDIIAQRQRTQMERQQGEIGRQQRYAALDVSNSNQLELAASCYQRELTQQSVDIVLVPPAESGHAALIGDWHGRLAQTHDKQEISARTLRGMPDNLCWLRSSWLSVFEMMSPSQLEARLPSICNLSTYGAADAPILRAVADLYQSNPVVFQRGLAASTGQTPLSVEAVRQRGAHLGPNLPLADLLGVPPNTAIQSRQMGSTPEDFLQKLQLQIATAFRPPVTSDRRFMDEIESLQKPGITATSNLPVTLHRALGLPVLVIETGSIVSHGEHGEQINQSAQLRVSAPNTSELATVAQQIAQQPGLQATAGSILLERCRNMPVIWLDGDHYSVYLPKHQPATTQQAVLQPTAIAI